MIKDLDISKQNSEDKKTNYKNTADYLLNQKRVRVKTNYLYNSLSMEEDKLLKKAKNLSIKELKKYKKSESSNKQINLLADNDSKSNKENSEIKNNFEDSNYIKNKINNENIIRILNNKTNYDSNLSSELKENIERNIGKVSNYNELQDVYTFEASNVDFMDFGCFINSCIDKCSKGLDSGIIKIKPPTQWILNYKKSYHNVIDDILKKDSLKKFDYKLQKLKHLNLGDKFEFNKDISYINYLKYSDYFNNKVFISKVNDKDNENTNNNVKNSEYNNTENEVCNTNDIKIFNKENIIPPIQNKESCANLINKSDDNLNTCKNKLPNIEVVESTYWEYAKGNVDNQKDVIYIANIELLKLVPKNEIKKHLYSFYMPYRYNLLNLCFSPDSLFQFTHKEGEEIFISGVNIPYIYYSMLFSTFSWQVEELYMYGVNYIIEGEPKIWYSVSSKDFEKLEDYARKNSLNKFDIFNEIEALEKAENEDKKTNLAYSNNLYQRYRVQFDPIVLNNSGIKVYRTVQYPGELIVSLPKSYFMGFSTGQSKSESVNFVNYNWIPYGKEAVCNYKKHYYKPRFSFEWLLFKNNYYKNDCMFTDKIIRIITSSIQDIIEVELSIRDVVENFLNNNNIKYRIESINYKYSIDCMICPNRNYMSFIQCYKCNLKACINHFKFCNCELDINEANNEDTIQSSQNSIVLYYRFNSDLKYYSKSKAN